MHIKLLNLNEHLHYTNENSQKYLKIGFVGTVCPNDKISCDYLNDSSSFIFYFFATLSFFLFCCYLYFLFCYLYILRSILSPPPLFLTSWLIGVSRSASCCPSPFSWVVSPYLPMREAYSVTELQAHALHTSRYSAHSCWAYPAFFSPGERIARIHREARLRAKTTDAPLPCSWEVKSMDCEHVVQ